jgi:hypothetical protein
VNEALYTLLSAPSVAPIACERLGLTFSDEPRSKKPEMRVRLSLVLLLVSVIAALTPLAYIETPDEIWLGGFFDNDDQDDAIVNVQTHLNAVEPPVPAPAVFAVPCSHAPPELYTCVVLRSIPSARQPRAPPTL